MPRFVKYSGAGNDFAVMLESSVAVAGRDDFARRVCSRRTGVGVDGLILIRPEGRDRVAVRFFNPDGSEFGTCGNGSRCAAKYSHDEGLVSGDGFILATPPADITCSIANDRVTLDYRIETWVDRVVSIDSPEGPGDAWLVQIGLPHFVVPVHDMPEGDIEELCRPLRHHPALGPEGANVNLVQLLSRTEGLIRTFERGVEGETQACGSGSMASIIALYEAGDCERSVTLRVTGGDSLSIELLPEAELRESVCSTVRLAGPAVRIFDGDFPVPT